MYYTTYYSVPMRNVNILSVLLLGIAKEYQGHLYMNFPVNIYLTYPKHILNT